MLTKEHLRYRIRTGRVAPVFVEDEDAATRRTAADLVGLFSGAVGHSLGELEQSATEIADDPIGLGLTKLLLDGCEMVEDDGKVAESRWAILGAAQRIRRERGITDAAELRRLVAAERGVEAADLAAGLYADLPDCRVVQAVRATSVEALLCRYNCAQVQGLLLRAREVTLRLHAASLAERRLLFRQLRFHRLLAQVETAEGGDIVASLSGPLGIFDQAATYGLRLANFFPHLLHLSSWSMTAIVSIKGRNLELRLDDACGLTSPYERHLPYIPEELTAFVASFNDRGTGYTAAVGGDFVNIGRESYCFPDLTITGQGGDVAHVELFHRWHAGTLAHRLQSLERNPDLPLIIGVSKSLAKDAAVASALTASGWFAKKGFFFAEFPTPRALLEVLERSRGRE